MGLLFETQSRLEQLWLEQQLLLELGRSGFLRLQGGSNRLSWSLGMQNK